MSQLNLIEKTLKVLGGLILSPLAPLCFQSVRINSVILVYRFGKFDRMVNPGLRWIAPFGKAYSVFTEPINKNLNLMDKHGNPIIINSNVNYKIVLPRKYMESTDFDSKKDIVSANIAVALRNALQKYPLISDIEEDIYWISLCRNFRLERTRLAYKNIFQLTDTNESSNLKLNIWLTNPKIQLNPLLESKPSFIQPQNLNMALVMDEKNRILVSNSLYGSGKILLCTLSNTYRWLLAGNQFDYNTLWTAILKNVGSKKSLSELWQVSPAIPRINQPIAISLQTDPDAHPMAQEAGATVALTKNQVFPFLYTGTFWPQKKGWQSGVQLNGTIYYWYVFGEDDFKNVQAADIIEKTEQLANNKPSSGAIFQTKQDEVPIPKIIFFSLFLICAGYLWFENKYYGIN